MSRVVPLTYSQAQIASATGAIVPLSYLSLNGIPFAPDAAVSKLGMLMTGVILGTAVQITLDGSASNVGVPDQELLIDTLTLEFEDANNKIHNIFIDIEAHFQLPEVSGSGNGNPLLPVDQPAQFGDETLAFEGGFQPFRPNGEAVPVTAIVAQNGSTRTASVVNGRMVLDGLPVAGDVFTISTADGDIDVTIELEPGATASNKTELEYWVDGYRTESAPKTIYLRTDDNWDWGSSIDVNDNTGDHVFHKIRYTATNRLTVTKHSLEPNPKIIDTLSSVRGTKYITWKDLDMVTLDPNFRSPHLVADSPARTGLDRTEHLHFEDINFYGQEIPFAVLNDPNNWDAGYAGAATRGIKMHGNWHGEYRRLTFRNAWQAMDVGLIGKVVLDDLQTEFFYYDNIRFTGNPDVVNLTDNDVKLLNNIRAHGVFSKNNEMIPPFGNSQEPHTDFMAGVSGIVKNVVMSRCYVERGDYRGDTMQSTHMDGTEWENIGLNLMVAVNRDSPWGINPNRVDRFQAAYSTYTTPNDGTDFSAGTAIIRLGSNPSTTRGSWGELGFEKFALVNQLASPFYVVNNPAVGVDDPGYIVAYDSYMVGNTKQQDMFVGPLTTNSIDDILPAYTPKLGSELDIDGQGALDTNGNFRPEPLTPITIFAPAINVSGGVTTISPPPEVNHEFSTPALTWTIMESDVGTGNWTELSTQPVSTTSYDISALTGQGKQFAVRYNNPTRGIRSIAVKA